MWPFYGFQYGFSSSLSTADLLAVKSDRGFRPRNRSESTQALAPDMDEAFDRVWHPGLLYKPKS